MEQSFWALSTVAQVGLSRIHVNIRFETVFVAENGTSLPCCRLWLSYQNDLSMLFTVTLPLDDVIKRWGAAFPVVLHQFIEATSLSQEDPRRCCINIIHDREAGTLSFYVDLASSANANIPTAIHLPFRLATDAQFKSHLLETVTELKEEKTSEKFRILDLENEIKCLKTTLEQKEKLCAWQEKQLDVFRTVYQKTFLAQTSQLQASEKAEVPKILECEDTTCLLPKCEDDTCSHTHSNATPTDQDDQLEMDHNDDDEEILDSNRNSVSSTPVPVVPQKTTNSDFLLGIATYLFCSLCPEKVSLPDTDQMTQHFIREHVDDEKRQCRACPEQLPKSPNDLLSHVKVHTNRIYACKFCGKKGRKNYLKSHIRVHSGENPFVCSVCQRTFSDSSTLRRHQTVHTGEKKHSCPICGRNMSRKDNVRVHLKSHHRNASPKPTSEQLAPS